MKSKLDHSIILGLLYWLVDRSIFRDSEPILSQGNWVFTSLPKLFLTSWNLPLRISLPGFDTHCYEFVNLITQNKWYLSMGQAISGGDYVSRFKCYWWICLWYYGRALCLNNKVWLLLCRSTSAKDCLFRWPQEKAIPNENVLVLIRKTDQKLRIQDFEIQDLHPKTKNLSN